MFRLLPTFYSSVQREKKKKNLLHDKASARVSIVIQQRWMTDKKIVPLDPHAFSRIFCILGVIIAVNNCLLTTFAICRLPSFVPILKWQQKIKRYFTPCLIIIAASHFFFQRIKQRSDYAWMTIHKNHRSAKQTVYYHLWFVAYYEPHFILGRFCSF